MLTSKMGKKDKKNKKDTNKQLQSPRTAPPDRRPRQQLSPTILGSIRFTTHPRTRTKIKACSLNIPSC
jgi:hypothetical protein